MAGHQGGEVGRIAASRYWRKTEAQVLVEAWRSSDESLGEFTARYGIAPRRLRRWAKRLEAGESETAEAVRWHGVRVEHGPDPVEALARAPFEIVLSEGCSVRVPAGFRAEDLERVLRVLSAAVA